MDPTTSTPQPQFQIWTLDECINESVGAIGTPEREHFEAQVTQKTKLLQQSHGNTHTR